MHHFPHIQIKTCLSVLAGIKFTNTYFPISCPQLLSLRGDGAQPRGADKPQLCQSEGCRTVLDSSSKYSAGFSALLIHFNLEVLNAFVKDTGLVLQ